MKFKNIPNTVVELESLIEIVDKQILSANIFDNESINISIFSFSDLENISEEQYSGEVLIYIISGTCNLKIKGKDISLKKGDVYKIKENTLHEIHANKAFKMLQITLK